MRLVFFLVFIILSCTEENNQREPTFSIPESFNKAKELYIKYDSLSSENDSLAQASLHEAIETIQEEPNAVDSYFNHYL